MGRDSLSVTALLLLGACTRSGVPEKPAAPYVETAVVQASGGDAKRYTGVVRSRIESDLGFRVAGKITARLVDPGQSVRRGQVLMRMDTSDLELTVQGASERSRAAEAEAFRAAADERRVRDLLAAGWTTRAAYDAAVAAKQSTAANLRAARAAAIQAGNQRDYGTLRADSNGVVTDVLAQPGQVVAAGTPVLKLASGGEREAEIGVSEDDLPSLPRVGTALIYGRDAPATAVLRQVAGSADPLTRTYEARYVIKGPAANTSLGATVTITLPRRAGGSLEVPLGAIIDRGRGTAVWIVTAHRRVRLQPVRVEEFGDETARLAPGALRGGERIVALGGQLLHESDFVRVASGRRG